MLFYEKASYGNSQEAVDARNATTHDYGEEMAQEICLNIVKTYYPTMKTIIHKALSPLLKT